MRTRSYSELSQLMTFDERFQYLSLGGVVGDTTFGHERYMNQRFYRSRAWKQVRDDVIIRDGGCDLGVSGYDIYKGGHIHHLNPITRQQILDFDDELLNLDNLILVTQATHNAIHYGDKNQLSRSFTERKPGDTKLWG